MSFAAIPVRSYTKTDPSWWNALRQAGILLENIIGVGGSIPNTAFTFANNQSTTNVTGLVFTQSATVNSARAWVSVRRTTGTNKIFVEVELWLSYDSVSAAWVLSDVVEHGSSASGITWTVTSAGQVRYSSSNLAGSGYSGASTFSAETAA